MPLYEFVCEECHSGFEELVRSASAAGEVTCPICKSPQVKRQVSKVARMSGLGGGFSFGSTSSGPSCSTGSV